MKEIDFITWWNENHTSQPSYQDVIDWAINKYKHEIKKYFEKFNADYLCIDINIFLENLFKLDNINK